MSESDSLHDRIDKLERQLAMVQRTNEALMDRVERGVSDAGSSYSVFERNLTLEALVSKRTKDAEESKEIAEKQAKALEQQAIALEEARARASAAEKRLRAKLDFILSPDQEAEALNLQDVIDIGDLQRIQDAFADATGVASLISDVEGNPVTEPSNFCGVCKLVRETKRGAELCILSDRILGERACETMVPTSETCHSCGFVDASAPITIGGRHIANWLIGQVNVRNVDRQRIKEYAEEIGANTDEMLEEFDNMSQMSMARFESILDLLWVLAQKLSALAFSNITLAKDVSERKATEAQLAQAKSDAEAANLAKSEFLANMSHEIRTPMTAILGFADVLLDSGGTADEMRDAAKIIKRNGEYLLCIINDILDLSKVEAGKMTIESISISPCQIIEEVISLTKVRAESRNLSLELEYDGPIPERISTDPTRLRQVLINLLGNAIKFTEIGSVRLIVGLHRTGNESLMRFDVIDTGCGLSASQSERLFQAFVQADPTMSRKHGGTGLGLIISKRLAQIMGGDVTLVESSPGVGTRFRAVVSTGNIDGVAMLDSPCSPELKKESTSTTCDGKPLLGTRILLAEDGPDNQRLITHLLKKMGAKVEVVGNGKLAMEAALYAEQSGNPPDVILMDMQMPVLDGYRATSQLRKLGYQGPIIALTAHAMASDRAKCINAGCNDYASKPIEQQKLTKVILLHLGNRAGTAN